MIIAYSLGIKYSGRRCFMRIAILAITLALAGCFQGEPNSSFLAGTWVSEDTGAKIKISADDDCRYYFESNKGLGLECALENLSQFRARITFSRGGVFSEGEIVKISDQIWFNLPSGGLDVLTLED